MQKLRRDNVTFRSCPRRLIDENTGVALRIDEAIDFGRKCEVEERELLNEMLELISNEIEELGNEAEIAHRADYARRRRRGWQLAVWERTQDMKAVVDQIVAETNEGLGL